MILQKNHNRLPVHVVEHTKPEGIVHGYVDAKHGEACIAVTQGPAPCGQSPSRHEGCTWSSANGSSFASCFQAQTLSLAQVHPQLSYGK